jgi:hypothetical protein
LVLVVAAAGFWPMARALLGASPGLSPILDEAAFVAGALGAVGASAAIRRDYAALLTRLTGAQRSMIEWIAISVGVLIPQAALWLAPWVAGFEPAWTRLVVSDLHLVALAAILLRARLSPELGGTILLGLVWLLPAWTATSPALGTEWVDAGRALRATDGFPSWAVLPPLALAFASCLLPEPTSPEE